MPSFVYITTSGLMFVVTAETYELELPHIFNENAHFKHFLIWKIYICSFRKFKLNLLNRKLNTFFFKMEHDI